MTSLKKFINNLPINQKLSYNKYDMTRIKRRLIFYFLVIVFIFVAPLTIFYATGYSYDLEKNKIVQTGGIYLKSNPSGAQIYLNEKLKNTTPSFLSRLTPNNYEIDIKKDGFYDWKKVLSVYPRLVTEARNVFLFPKNFGTELLDSNATTSISSYLMNETQRSRQTEADSTASTTAGWILDNQNLYFISKNDYTLYKSAADGSGKNQILINPLPKENGYKIYVSDNNFLALSEKNELYLFDKNSNSFNKIASDVKNAAFSNDNKKILYYNDNEIYVYFLEDILIQPYKKKGDREFMARQSQKISQAIFYPNNEYITYVSDNQIKTTELDGRSVRNTVDLLSVQNPEIYFDKDNNYFYYKTENRLYRFKLE